MQITKHFSFDEFVRSSTAEKHNIYNIPPKSGDIVHIAIHNIRYVAYMLEIIRKQCGFPIRITSGYRCAELNKLVGGSPKSNHLQGLAVDIDCGKSRNKKLYHTLYNLKNILPINELINEDDYSWIHVSFHKL